MSTETKSKGLFNGLGWMTDKDKDTLRGGSHMTAIFRWQISAFL